MKARDWVDSHCMNVSLLGEEYDEAFVGVASGNDGEPRAVYDYDKVMSVLERKGKKYGEALDYMEFELFGFWIKNGPMLLNRMPK